MCSQLIKKCAKIHTFCYGAGGGVKLAFPPEVGAVAWALAEPGKGQTIEINRNNTCSQLSPLKLTKTEGSKYKNINII